MSCNASSENLGVLAHNSEDWLFYLESFGHIQMGEYVQPREMLHASVGQAPATPQAKFGQFYG